MPSKADKTKESILVSAKKEFLRAGFRDASLRSIAADAGVTTGSIYRYFSGKDHLFETVILPAEQEFLSLHGALSADVFVNAERGAPYDKQPENAQILALLNLIYAHFDEYYLLIACSGGSAHENFVSRFALQEEQSALTYMDRLKQSVNSSYEVDRIAVHFLVEAYISAMLEPVRQKLSYQEAAEHTRFLFQFFNDGWAGVEKAIMDQSSS